MKKYVKNPITGRNVLSSGRLGNIITRRYNSKGGAALVYSVEPPQECIICQEIGTIDNPLCVVCTSQKIVHKYHRECINTWCADKNVCNCPICKSVIYGATCPGKGTRAFKKYNERDYMAAINSNNIQLVKLIINDEDGSIINWDDKICNLTLKMGLDNNDIDIVGIILPVIININDEMFNGLTPLMYAAKKCNISIIKILLQTRKDIDINKQQSQTGSTAVMYACINSGGPQKASEIAIMLLKDGANPNIVTRRGHTLLMECITGNLYTLAEQLIMDGVDVNQQNSDGNTALIYAVTEQNYSITQSLIKANAKINTQNSNGNTALLYAVKLKNYPITEFLIKANAKINDRNKTGVTPLYKSLHDSSYTLTTLLIANGANISYSDDGETPMASACRWGAQHIIEKLIELGVDIKVVSPSGASYLLYYLQSCKNTNVWNKDIINLLLNRGIDINQSDNNKVTPLMAAVDAPVEIVELLLKKHANPYLKSNGKTALEMCTKPEISQLIAVAETTYKKRGSNKSVQSLSKLLKK